MKWRIIEDLRTIVHDWDTDKQRVLRMWKYYHRKHPDRYHEVYQLNPDGTRWGIRQYKPGDIVRDTPTEPLTKQGIKQLAQEMSKGLKRLPQWKPKRSTQ